jgi:predicted MFS family arabinose efflux permease
MPYLTVAFALVVMLAGANVMVPLYGLYQARLGFGLGIRTLIIAIYGLALVPPLLWGGRLSDRMGRRQLAVGGLLLMLAGTGLFLIASAVWQLIVARAIYGFAVGLANAVLVASLTELQPTANTGLAIRSATLAQAIGPATSSFIAGFLEQYVPFLTTLPFLVYGILQLLALILLWWLMRETMSGRSKASGVGHLPRWRTVAYPRFWIGTLIAMLGFMVIVLFAGLVPAYLSNLLQVHNLAFQGAAPAVLLVSSAAAQFATRAEETQGIIRWSTAALAIGLSALVLAVSIHSPGVVIAATVIAGVGVGLGLRGGLALAVQATSPQHRAEALSVHYATIYLSVSASIIGFGYVSDSLGLFPVVRGFSLLVAVIAIVTVLGLNVRPSAESSRTREG